MRAKAYGAAIGALTSHTAEINSETDVKNIPGIGKKIYEKVQEYFRDGAFREAKSKFSDSKTKGLEELNEIWGVGSVKAEKLYDSGFTSVFELRTSKGGEEALTTMQKIGLQYYEDLRQKIPREEATKIANRVNAAVKKLFAN